MSFGLTEACRKVIWEGIIRLQIFNNDKYAFPFSRILKDFKNVLPMS